MVHFSCDVCGKSISGNDDRYVVRVDIRPASSSWELTEEDLEDDNLEKVSELLREEEATGVDPYEDGRPVRNRYDLCPACRDNFLKNPFACHATTKFGFSEN